MTETTPQMDDGRDGPPFVATLSSIFLTAGGVLLLPRQFVSAGIAFALGMGLRAVHRRRHPPESGQKNDPEPPQ